MIRSARGSLTRRCLRPGAGAGDGGRGGVVRAAPLHHRPEGQRHQEDDGGVRGQWRRSAAPRWPLAATTPNGSFSTFHFWD